jgi:hypothetical protein
MTTFTSDYAYLINLHDDNSFEITGRIWEPAIVATNLTSPKANIFEVGDELQLTVRGNYFGNFTYLGSSENGIVAINDTSGEVYAFPTTSFEVNTVYQLTPTSLPVCFVRGTLISTSRGYVAIESLMAGDLVQGSTGWRTVKWVGWRNYGAISFFTQESKSRVAPIRIRAHSIANNVPSSDLLTSPWHHLFVDGKLVRAGDLVNGTTITQETHVNEVSYYHVELDQFDVVMAHGVYSESYADGGNRDFFQNVEVTSLRPEDKIRRRASRPGFDHLVLRQGKELVAIQDRIAQRAKAIASIETQKQKVA